MDLHSLFLGVIPSIAALWILGRHYPVLRDNKGIFLASLLLGALQALPPVQAVYASVWQRSGGLFAHGAPVFVILYLMLGRFDRPSVMLTWAGTYLCLLATDLAFSVLVWRSGFLDLPTMLTAIGGAGWMDGLLWIPIASAALTYFVVWRLNQGDTFVSMLGRKAFLKSQQR